MVINCSSNFKNAYNTLSFKLPNKIAIMGYQSNFLSKVLIRLDFDRSFVLQENAHVDMQSKFSACIKHIFPYVNSQPLISASFNIGPEGSGIINQQTNVSQWQYRKIENGTCIVTLNPTFLAIEYGKGDYQRYSYFYDDVIAVLKAFIDLFSVSEFRRIGLRYINEIVLNEGKPLDWKGFISSKLISAVKAGFSSNAQMVRSMHQLQVQRSDSTVLFNYGIHNPDYPNPLVRRVFILDYDASKIGVISSDAFSTFDELHRLCREMFETSIDAKLREMMGGDGNGK